MQGELFEARVYLRGAAPRTSRICPGDVAPRTFRWSLQFGAARPPGLHPLPFDFSLLFVCCLIYYLFDLFLLLQPLGSVPSIYLQSFTSNALTQIMSGDLLGARYCHFNILNIYLSNLIHVGPTFVELH